MTSRSSKPALVLLMLEKYSTAGWQIFCLNTEMQSKTIEAPQIQELSSISSWQSDQSVGSCGLADGKPCYSGCWFILGSAGCKQGSTCTHCHEEICCLIADMRRREVRKQHSRTRPSKKRREHEKRQRAIDSVLDETESVTTAGCESSHSAISSDRSSSVKQNEPRSLNVPNDMKSIADLIELIRIAVESDGFKQ
jgi:hypothetical protein